MDNTLSIEAEEWRDIPGFEGFYKVSENGKVWSCHSQSTLSIFSGDGRGYLHVNLSANGRRYRRSIHYLVAIAFIGPRPSGYVVDHINRVRSDNRVSNLRYLLSSENSKQGSRDGEENANSKLTNCQRCKIRELWATGSYSQRELAQMYGVTPNNIGKIVHSKNGRHINCAEYAAATSADARAAVCRQAKADGYTTSQIAAAIEAERTPDAVELETVNHHLTVWFMSHKGCSEEIDQFNAGLDELDTLTADDDEANTYLRLTYAKDWYRSLYGREWSR